MVISKEFSGKLGSTKKAKKKFDKNNSFSGVETKKNPKNRRKSIAGVVATPLKKDKVKSSNQWVVSDISTGSTARKRKQLVITDSDDEIELEVNTTTSIKTPKVKTKRKSSGDVTRTQDKLVLEIKNPSSSIKSTVSASEKKDKKSHVEDKLIGSNEDVESEQKFGIETKAVAAAIQAAIKLHRENPKLQNQLFDDPIGLYLHVGCHKVPQAPSRIIRIPLPNSLLTPDDEICLIVPELKGVKNIEHEKHIEHYENLLRSKGVENIKKIMTFHQFRTEYETFEQKRRLVDLYEMFLVDGRISGKVVKKCGKIFYKKRKIPTPVKLHVPKLKSQIDNALSKAFFLLHLKGDSYSVQFGHDKMTTQQLVDNLFAVIEGLDKEFPGGFANIKVLFISTLRSTSIPIYSSFKSPKEIELPKVISKKPKSYKTYTGELTTLPNANVVVKPTGRVIVKRTKDEEESTSAAVNNQVEGEGENATKENGVKKTKKRKRSAVSVESSADTTATEVKKKKKAVVNVAPAVHTDKKVQKKKKVSKNGDVKLEGNRKEKNKKVKSNL